MDMMTSVGDGSTARANGHDDGREARHCLRIHFVDGSALDSEADESVELFESKIRSEGGIVNDFGCSSSGNIAMVNMRTVTYVERIYPDGLA